MKAKYQYKAQLKRVVDGDTMDLEVDLGFYVITRQRFRLLDIDTPEIYGSAKDSEEYVKGQAAKKFVEARFQDNQGQCVVKSTKTGVYGRWLGEIFFEDSSQSLNNELLKEGLAEQYNK